MADTTVSKTVAARHVGSTPTSGTNLAQGTAGCLSSSIAAGNPLMSLSRKWAISRSVLQSILTAEPPVETEIAHTDVGWHCAVMCYNTRINNTGA